MMFSISADTCQSSHARLEHVASGWRVISSTGEIVREGLTNAQAWRVLDRLNNEAVSAQEAKADYKEPVQRASVKEKQEFYSGLLHIAATRGYKIGWAWHKFHERFGCVPDELRRDPAKPTKQVWGWVNRKAIKREERA
jgi:hypothetical protein